jgi:hypothetical protein
MFVSNESWLLNIILHNNYLCIFLYKSPGPGNNKSLNLYTSIIMLMGIYPFQARNVEYSSLVKLSSQLMGTIELSFTAENACVHV